MNRFVIAAVTCLVSAASAEAQSAAALVIASEDYSDIRDMRAADDVGDAARRLTEAGVDVVLAENADRDRLDRALRRFEDEAGQADTLIVVLAGAFAHTATETYFLHTDIDEDRNVTDLRDALSLDTVTAWLADTPGRAILVLATDDDGEALGPFVESGPGDVDVPQGVTLVTGGTGAVEDFLADTLAQRGATVSARRGLTVGGYAPDDLVILPTASTGGRPVAADPDRDDLAAWREALDRDTLDGYRSYLFRFPRGTFAEDARRAIDALERSPEDRAEAAEDALQLNRDARRAIQRDLSMLDYDTRGIDGIFGAGTRQAIRSWQADQDRAQTGFLDRAQIETLAAQADRRAAELEAEAERRQRQLQAQDRAYWDETGALGRESGYRQYLERYPDGEFADVARERLEDIERRNRRETNQRDRAAWDFATRQNTIQAYRQYLEEQPNGRFRDEAETRIRQIRARERDASRNEAARQEEDALNLNPITRRLIEQRLASAGFDPGPQDGIFEDRTRQALRRYQRSRGLPETGYLNEDVVVRLLADSVRSIFD